MGNISAGNADKQVSRKAFLKLAGAGAVFVAMPGSVLLNPEKASAAITKTYQEIGNYYFPNPERGWYTPIDPNYFENRTQDHEGTQYDRPQPLTTEELQKHRAEGVTLVRKYYVLYDYRESLIPQSYLEEHPIHDLNLVRENGFKLIPRFIYVWNTTDFDDRDASVEWIVRHLDQLAPILQENYDVISHMDMGLVGYYGEWHTSMNGNLGGTWTNQENGALYEYNVLNQNSLAIINKILEVLPQQRMAIIRYVHQLQQLHQDIYGQDLTEQLAYSGTDQARIGLQDDSVMYSVTHRGGYWPPTTPEGAEIRRKEREFQEEVTQYIPMFGESSGDGGSGYILKSDPLVEFETMHWRAQNNGWYEAVRDGVYDYWKEHGAYDELSMRFGYRFSLVDATIPEEVRPKGTFNMAFNVKNTGFGAPYNRRLLEVVLRHVSTGAEYYANVPLSSTDPRRWWPGQTANVSIAARVPGTMPTGRYTVFLNLPDPDPRLNGKPEYSIRLANEGVWENYSGYNSLGAVVRVRGENAPNPNLNISAFARRSNPPTPNGSSAITLTARTVEYKSAPTPELLETNDVLVDFEDHPDDVDDKPIEAGYGGVDWSGGDWRLGLGNYGKCLYIYQIGTIAQATFRLPTGKVLKSFMLLKVLRDAEINRITLRSGGQEYVWDNPTPWWAQHELPEEWQRNATNEITVEAESTAAYGGGNLRLDNLVYGDPPQA